MITKKNLIPSTFNEVVGLFNLQFESKLKNSRIALQRFLIDGSLTSSNLMHLISWVLTCLFVI